MLDGVTDRFPHIAASREVFFVAAQGIVLFAPQYHEHCPVHVVHGSDFLGKRLAHNAGPHVRHGTGAHSKSNHDCLIHFDEVGSKGGERGCHGRDSYESSSVTQGGSGN